MPSKELIQEVIDFWQPYSKEKLTEKDAIEIMENLTALFDFLDEEDRRQRKAFKGAKFL
jgi:hypothetical protein